MTTQPDDEERRYYEEMWQHEDRLELATGGQSGAVNFRGFFTRERPPTRFDIPILAPEGRQTAIYASHKVGKSLLLADACAAAATGRSVLGQEPQEPVRVLYLDFEMAEEDLLERLRNMGYGPDDEALLAENLRYHLHPATGSLDTEQGAARLIDLVASEAPRVVVIDTLSRVIRGRENDSDTFIQFYRCTGLPLRRLGVSLVRLDHSGYDGTHARGSTAKGDDVDTVYQLKRRGDGTFTLSHGGVSRVPWMPDNVRIERLTDPLRHVATIGEASATAVASPEMKEALRRSEIVHYVKANPGVTGSGITAALKGERAKLLESLKALVLEEKIRTEPGPNRSVKHFGIDGTVQ